METNNRELALLIWIVVFLTWVVTRPQVRRAILPLLKAALQLKLSIIYGVMAAYTALIVYLLYRNGLWDSSQFKNTILWFLTVGLFSLKDIVKPGQINYFRKTATDVVSLTAILQFITGVYTFSFVTEFILVPVAALIGGMIVVAEKKPEYVSVKKIFNWILVLAGLYTIAFTIYKIATDFKTFANRGTLNDFLIPGALSFLFLPLVYLLSLYAVREGAFAGLRNQLPPKLLRLARWYTLRNFAFNRNDLRRWRKYVSLRRVESKEDLVRTIEFIKQLKKIEKNPPIIPIEIGWSPYKEKEVLATEGLITSYYQPYIEEEWSASSNYFEIDDDIISNNIAYYIEGNSHAVETLKLNLNVNDPKKANSSHTKMVSCAKLLYRFALNEDISKTILDALIIGTGKKLQIGDKFISVYKNCWPEHRLKGYNIKLTIGIVKDTNE